MRTALTVSLGIVCALHGCHALALFAGSLPHTRCAAVLARYPPAACMADAMQDEDNTVFEVTVPRPLGFQLKESNGVVMVGMVFDGGNAAQQGIEVGDVVLATSASMGSQMWPKSTLEGVKSAIQTRLDGMVRLRLRRPRAQNARSDWETAVELVEQVYEVELARPLGLVLRQLPAGSAQTGVEVAELAADGSAAASGAMRIGDVLLATSASIGDQMWDKSTLEGALAAISTRLSLAPTVRLRLKRLDRLGSWASELREVAQGERSQLSPSALRSLRAQWRELRAMPAFTPEITSAVRNLTFPAVRAIIERRGRRAPARSGAPAVSAADDASTLAKLLGRLGRLGIALDCSLASGLMSAALRCGHARLALAAFEQLVDEGASPDCDVYTTLIRVYAALEQRSEAVAVLQRMRADQVDPTVPTYNALMAVCARATDRAGMLEHFGMIRAAGLRPTVATWNIILDYCANQQGVEIEQVFERMRSEGIVADVISYATIIKAAVAKGDLARAEALLEAMIEAEVEPDVVVLNTMLMAYATVLRRDSAFEILRRFEARGVSGDALSYSLLLRNCVRGNAPEPATRAVEAMRKAGLRPSTRVYSMLLSSYARSGWLRESLEVLQLMQAEKTRPNKYTFSALMEACITSGQPETARPLFEQMQELDIAADTVTYTLLVRALVAQAPRLATRSRAVRARARDERVAAPRHAVRASGARDGDISFLYEAFAAVDEMCDGGASAAPNVITFNALLQGCADAGEADLILRALCQMLARGIAANRNTFRILAAELPAPPGTAPRDAAAARLAYLRGMIDVFEDWGRQLNGEVYLTLLRVCGAAPGGAAVAREMIHKRCVQQEAVRGERATFVLRQAQLGEVTQLESRFAAGAPTDGHKPGEPPPADGVGPSEMQLLEN